MGPGRDGIATLEMQSDMYLQSDTLLRYTAQYSQNNVVIKIILKNICRRPRKYAKLPSMQRVKNNFIISQTKHEPAHEILVLIP